jgi:hypothetical protein
VVQAYVGEDAPPLPVPLSELKGFERIHLAPSEKP